ncbi:MAG: hypothetical protein L0G99_12975, partial [Propionibacteriales bacterium]|nr:hypothetical protein [Propionibacteriales bacterium]
MRAHRFGHLVIVVVLSLTGASCTTPADLSPVESPAPSRPASSTAVPMDPITGGPLTQNKVLAVKIENTAAAR